MDYLILAMIVSFAGGIWMFFSASSLINPLAAFAIVVVHIVVCLATTVPFVFVLYVAFWLASYYAYHHKLPEDELPRFASASEVTQWKCYIQ